MIGKSMKNELKIILSLFFILFAFSPNLSNAFFHDKLVKDLQKNLPTQGKSNKSQNQNSGGGAEKTKKKVEDGEVDYSSSSIISFAAFNMSSLHSSLNVGIS